MIYEALKLIRDELALFLDQKNQTDSFPLDEGAPLEDELITDVTATDVLLDNIALIESGSREDLDDKVIITLVNTEEERSLKNTPPYKKSPLTGSIKYVNPPIFLNLYLLFSANFPNKYEVGLVQLSYIVQFFQSKSIFTIQNSPNSPISTRPDDPQRSSIRVIFNLYSMTFEQLNHLWGSLGGKQVPAVMYRVWLVEEKEQQTQFEGPIIEQIRSSEVIK